jgi:hypothetical protein
VKVGEACSSEMPPNFYHIIPFSSQKTVFFIVPTMGILNLISNNLIIAELLVCKKRSRIFFGTCINFKTPRYWNTFIYDDCI